MVASSSLGFPITAGPDPMRSESHYLITCNPQTMSSICALLFLTAAVASHVVAWGAWKPIRLVSGQEIRVRALLIDGRTKEYSTGDSHQITETVSVARKVFRLNNALHSEPAKPQWVWKLGGWMSINSATGHVAELKLPEFDSQSSEASWFQDYAAYCGVAEGGMVHYMMVFQLGRRKPVLMKELPGKSCLAPTWERDPTRVTFEPDGERKMSFTINNGIAELQSR